MKIIKIVMFIAVLLFSIPLDTVAGEHDGDMCSTHRCVLVCHTCCYSAIAPHIEMPAVPPSSFAPAFVSDFSYQNPSLDTFKRPPVVSA